ncbi:1-phosphofructokinase family hexose kinase [Microbacterium stercoris]|uniref:1-phosphofructokinase family hexose kinase n=1 Tax=Microbacterium stercoris TaxID=2820289 RepID=A0A939QR14_9MICO|nr:1-phosphofructokinase family hexose kinase [Microbacterium stercoris]MBO3663071.1 1-phosphofructokinase family hexose kinase [Microbacterium stercoris]
MIVTLTMNPALDRTVELADVLEPGEVQSALSVREDPGGKGVNVARVLRAAGHPVTAVLPLAHADPYRVALGDLPVRTVPITAHARVNLTLTDPYGETTKINLAGSALTRDHQARLIDAVVVTADGADWLVMSGSLPPGVAADFYVDVALAVRSRAKRPPRIAVDTSGRALAEAVASGGVDLIKPNEEELAGLLSELGLASVAELVPAQVRAVLLTRGGDGATLIDASGEHDADAPRIEVRSTVGAGDSSLAGYLLADVAGLPPAERVATAIRYGSATAALPGTRLAELPFG